MAIDAKDTCACAVLFRSFAIQMPTRLTFPKVDFDTPNVHVTGLGRFQDVRLEESVVAWGRLLCLWFPFDERLQSGKYRGQVRVRRCVHTLWFPGILTFFSPGLKTNAFSEKRPCARQVNTTNSARRSLDIVISAVSPTASMKVRIETDLFSPMISFGCFRRKTLSSHWL